MPTLTIVAGANGSGKTTFAVPYTARIGVQFLNADELAKGFAQRGEPNAMLKGGREFFRLLNGALDRKEDVVIETTLSGNYTEKVRKRARKLGYRIEMVYIYLSDVRLCVERVAYRVRKGGHDVPKDDIVRRYGRSIRHFAENFAWSVDVWHLFYNGYDGFQLVAQSEWDEVEIVNPNLYAKFTKIWKTIPKE